MKQYPRGSEWRKWDLHIHTPLSGLNSQFPKKTDGTPDWEPYIRKLGGIDAAVIGITDYFLIDGYKKVKEVFDAGGLGNIELVLPNIEFRIDKIIGKTQKRLTVHVIFSNAVSVDQIEEHFLGNLSLTISGAPGKPDDARRLKRSSLLELGQRLKREHLKFKEKDDFSLGCEMAVI